MCVYVGVCTYVCTCVHVCLCGNDLTSESTLVEEGDGVLYQVPSVEKGSRSNHV